MTNTVNQSTFDREKWKKFVEKYCKLNGQVIDSFDLYEDVQKLVGKEPTFKQFQDIVNILKTDYKCKVVSEEDLNQEYYDEEFDTTERKENLRSLNLKDLVRRFQETRQQQYLAEFIVRNKGFIMNVVYKQMRKNISFTTEDLYQLGVLGIIKGIDGFDLSLGYSPLTYLYFYILQSIQRGIQDEAYLVRIPVHMHETISRFNRICYELSFEGINKEDQIKEAICGIMDISDAKYYELKRFAEQYLSPISLHTPVGGEGGNEDSYLMNFMEDKRQQLPEDMVGQHLLQEKLKEVLDTLSPREQQVLRLRFGLDDNRTRTLEEVGRYFQVTRERIRQIEVKALRKLRHPSRSKKLKDYLE